jgi:hypothetical protein
MVVVPLPIGCSGDSQDHPWDCRDGCQRFDVYEVLVKKFLISAAVLTCMGSVAYACREVRGLARPQCSLRVPLIVGTSVRTHRIPNHI